VASSAAGSTHIMRVKEVRGKLRMKMLREKRRRSATRQVRGACNEGGDDNGIKYHQIAIKR